MSTETQQIRNASLKCKNKQTSFEYSQYSINNDQGGGYDDGFYKYTYLDDNTQNYNSCKSICDNDENCLAYRTTIDNTGGQDRHTNIQCRIKYKVDQSIIGDSKQREIRTPIPDPRGIPDANGKFNPLLSNPFVSHDTRGGNLNINQYYVKILDGNTSGILYITFNLIEQTTNKQIKYTFILEKIVKTILYNDSCFFVKSDIDDISFKGISNGITDKSIFLYDKEYIYNSFTNNNFTYNGNVIFSLKNSQSLAPVQICPTTPGITTPGKTTPGKTTPGKTTPGKTTPGKTTPGKTTPGKTTPKPKASSFLNNNNIINKIFK